MRFKVVILMIAIILFTIFVTQNTLVIPVDIYFWRVEMSVIVLISICALIGIMIGFAVVKLFDRPKEKPMVNLHEGPENKGIKHIR
jgi:uncharacterized integral membrane protein